MRQSGGGADIDWQACAAAWTSANSRLTAAISASEKRCE